MNYTLNQLEIFLKVVKTKSVTKASEELFLTQPAVSIQLKNFQDQFDIPLTEVIGRKIYITDFGYEIAKSAENILNQVHAINYKTMAYKGKLIGNLKIAIASTGKYVMPFFLSDFLHKNSGIELVMDVTNKNKVIESLEKNEVDFALVSILPTKLQVEKLDLLQNKLFLVGSSLFTYNTINKIETVLEKQPLIFREEGSGTLQVMESFLKTKNISVLKKMELTSNEAVKQAIMAGLGVSIMPLIGIRNELYNKELKIIPVKGLPIITNWSIIWNKGKSHSPASQAFIEYLNDEIKNIVEKKFNWYEDFE
jgi:DNA-binding transcriptional LysR family regulator